MLWKDGFAVASLCAERNAPSLASAALPPRSTQATAPHARSLPYSSEQQESEERSGIRCALEVA